MWCPQNRWPCTLAASSGHAEYFTLSEQIEFAIENELGSESVWSICCIFLSRLLKILLTLSQCAITRTIWRSSIKDLELSVGTFYKWSLQCCVNDHYNTWNMAMNIYFIDRIYTKTDIENTTLQHCTGTEKDFWDIFKWTLELHVHR